jgi:SAM-dependent methyltransferase
MAGSQEMRSAWDQRAQRDAFSSIEASRQDWTDEEFFAHGRGMVEWVMRWLGDGVDRGRMLEVGCGLGRTALAFAQVFERVEGVDVSPRMIERAVEAGLPENVRLRATDGESLAPFEDASFDFVFSEHVFQHIADAAVIGRYLREVARVLSPGSVALLQFDTRRAGLATRLYGHVPDWLLRRGRRRYMRRYRRDPAWIRESAEAAGLAVESERGESGHYHWFMLRRVAR